MLKGKPYIILICITAGLGGFLFGFDTAVIAGAVNFLRIQFQLSPAMEGWVISSALLGCVLGAAMAGYLSDKYGRKKILVASALLFIISSVGCMVAETPVFLAIARIVGGIGVGFAAMVAPLFIAELSPPDLRGKLVSVYQLAIAFGILVSYLSNSCLLDYALDHASQNEGGLVNLWLVKEVWRGMLGSNALPAIIFLICLLLIPESPRWLIKALKDKEGFQILERINGKTIAAREFNDIKNTLAMETGNFSQLFQPNMRTALLIGLILPFFSQLTGINTVMYYAPAIFEKAGFHSASAALGGASVIGFANVVFTLLAIWKIDKWGRKALLMAGFGGLSMVLMLIGYLFAFHDNAAFILAAFILYCAIFSATLGPGVWVVLAEIYPTKIRGRAMSVGTLALFFGSAFVTQTYPILRESGGNGMTFFLYGICILPIAWFVKKVVPETKGKSLEEIERHWEEEAAATAATTTTEPIKSI